MGAFLCCGHPCCIARKPCGLRAIFSRLCRADDRGIARATAQIARQNRVVITAPIGMACDHRSNKAGRAKAALRPVMRDHGLLHRVQRVSANALNGANSFAINLG